MITKEESGNEHDHEEQGASRRVSGVGNRGGAVVIEAVLADFSGTLARVEPAESWLRAVVESAGERWPDERIAADAALLERAGGLAGGASPASIPPSVQADWDRRDLDAAAHRRAYTGLILASDFDRPDLAEALYDRHSSSPGWSVYPDVPDALTAIRASGRRIAVLSNVGWDIQAVLDGHGVTPLVDDVVQSYQVGLQKPDPAIFALACQRLGVHPTATVMVGDNEVDRGGEPLGITTLLVDPLPADQRPNGFAPLRRLLGV